MSKLKKISFPIILSLLGVASFFVTSNLVNQRGSISGNYAYQVIELLIALCIILTLHRTKKQLTYLKLGELNSPSTQIELLGITSKDTWKDVGLRFAVIITLATTLFLFFSLPTTNQLLLNGHLLKSLALALPLAIMNAFNEEILTRWTIVEGLEKVLPSNQIAIISAVIFGIPHYFGVPGGFIGSIMAGFLGWLLSITVQDTKGIGWAVAIHFLQDLVIFTYLLAPLF